MVLRKDNLSPEAGSINKNNYNNTMSNEQPVTKRQRIETTSGATGDQNQQHNENHLNVTDEVLTSSDESSSSISSSPVKDNESDIISQDELDNVQQMPSSCLLPISDTLIKNSDLQQSQQQHQHNNYDMEQFQNYLIKQCLCGVSERILRRPFQGHYNEDNNGAKRIAALHEWPQPKLIQFLSNIQLLFDIYLKQNAKGMICARIMDVCDALIRNEHNLIDEIIDLCDYDNKYVTFLSGKVLSSFLIIAKDNMDNNWLKKIVNNLFMFEHIDFIAVRKINFSLDIIKRIVEWKDLEQHPLEDLLDGYGADNGTQIQQQNNDNTSNGSVEGRFHGQLIPPPIESNYFAVHYNSHFSNTSATASSSSTGTTSGTSGCSSGNNLRQSRLNTTQSTTSSSLSVGSSSSSHITAPDISLISHPANIVNTSNNSNECQMISLTDSESFDTTHLKCLTIKILENKWPALVKIMSTLILSHRDINYAECCIVQFLCLWECIISVKANLSVVETLPFYAQLDKFELLLLNQNLSNTIYKQMLTLFNEALCYGSTLALQDLLPEETCNLAHQIVRHVKDFRILDSIPKYHIENPVSLIGYKGVSIIYDNETLNINTIAYNNSNDDDENNHTIMDMDKTLLQKMVLLVLKSVAITVKEIRSDSSDSSIDSQDYDTFHDMVLIERSIRDVLKKLELFIKNQLEFHPDSHFSKILIHLFEDQDDYLIEAMVCTLDVISGISYRNNAFPELITILNPLLTFIEFLKLITNSSDLLLDLLVSNETCFLLYLLRLLKYIRLNWTMFIINCNEYNNNCLDQTMSVLIRLRLQISRLVSKSLYPYDIAPVLRLLESCESLYEGNELS